MPDYGILEIYKWFILIQPWKNMFPFYVCMFTCLWASIITLCSKENYNISAHHHTSTEFFVNYDNYMSEE